MTTVPRGTIIGHGNSIMAGHPASFVITGFFKGAENSLNYGAGMSWVNLGHDGWRTDQLIAEAPTLVDPLLGAGPTNIVFMYEFVNDMAQGQCAAVHVFNRTRRYCGERRARGFKVIVSTMMPAYSISANGLEPQRLLLNTMIRQQYTSFADGLADFAADAQMGLEANVYPTSNLLYFAADGIHPNQGGHDRLAPIAAAAIAALAA